MHLRPRVSVRKRAQSEETRHTLENSRRISPEPPAVDQQDLIAAEEREVSAAVDRSRFRAARSVGRRSFNSLYVAQFLSHGVIERDFSIT
jgi:hypothetical protein